MRLTLRIDIGEQQKFGPGKARLLELIAEHGSITAAGRAMGMSYRRAWMLVDDLNSMFTGKLVDAKPGGSGGGGAHLTDLGRDVLSAYRRLEAHAASAPDLAAIQAYLPP
jgi:molybdate transport system regulatory protein